MLGTKKYLETDAAQFLLKSLCIDARSKYNLRDDEIILLHSLLTQNYFEDIVLEKVNPYVKAVSYDYTDPQISFPYSNKINADYQRDFLSIGSMIHQVSSPSDWVKIYKKIIYWELELDSLEEKSMLDILLTQKNSLSFCIICKELQKQCKTTQLTMMFY